MKKLIFAVLALAFAGTAYALTNGLPQPADVRNLLNQGGPEGIRAAQLGTQVVDKKIQVMKALYDFSKSGGSSSAAITLLDVDGKAAVLPNKAIIKQVTFDVITAPTAASGSPTLAFTANSAADLKAALIYSSWSGLVAGIPVGSAATSIKLTAKRTLTMSIASANLSAGKINVFVEYYLSD